VPILSQHVLQLGHKSLELLAIMRSVVDGPAKSPDFLVHAAIGFVHISPSGWNRSKAVPTTALTQYHYLIRPRTLPEIQKDDPPDRETANLRWPRMDQRMWSIAVVGSGLTR